ncbi:Fc.00g043520.m01.CDS01 [Cosmosporella sp. VM-42]
MAGRLFMLCLTLTALAAPATEKRSPCTNPQQRNAWQDVMHAFSDEEKRAYLDAELCLMEKPATLGLRGTKTVFDELQSCHVLQAEITHYVGAFLPFHRLLMWAHEHKLRTECRYQGAQPCWQEQLDAGDFINSPVFDAELGFGGNGTGPNNCIEDGPFVDYRDNIGPRYVLNEHCIDRKVDNLISMSSSQRNVGACLAQTNWLDAWHCIEGQPHYGGHGGVGKEMMNPISSPGDPLFYLHHTWLDKIWWDWQRQDLSVRLTEIGGQNRIKRNPDGSLPIRFSERPSDVPEPRVEGDPGDETTLNHIINMCGVVENMKIADVMDIRGEALCYEYI